MNKGYTLEVINRELRHADRFHYKTEEEAMHEMKTVFKNEFCILTEWAQFKDGLGNYEIEIERQNW